MLRSIRAVSIAGLLMLAPATLLAQGQPLLNPDISFIVDTRALAADATGDDLTFELTGLEIGAQAYLNPFVRGDIFLGIHDGALDVEEAYASFTALPGGLGVRGGVYRVEIGRFNMQHPHQFSFLDYPLLVTEFFGEEGYYDVGANPSLLLDVGSVPLTLSMNVLRGELGGHDHGHDEHAHESAGGRFVPLQDEEAAEEEIEAPRELKHLTYTGRASAFLEMGTSTWLEVGGTAGTGVLEVGGLPGEHEGELTEDVRATWFGGDFKLKWRPDRRTSLVVAGELLAQRRDLEHDHEHEAVLATAQEEDHEDEDAETRIGFFGTVDYQFRRHYNVGGLVDFMQKPEEYAFAWEGIDGADENRLGFGLFAGYSVFEESTVLRLLVRHDRLPGDLDAETSVQFQLLFGLGPHKPHQF